MTPGWGGGGGGGGGGAMMLSHYNRSRSLLFHDAIGGSKTTHGIVQYFHSLTWS